MSFRERFASPPWPSDVDRLEEGDDVVVESPVSGETTSCSIKSIDRDGPGVKMQCVRDAF